VKTPLHLTMQAVEYSFKPGN